MTHVIIHITHLSYLKYCKEGDFVLCYSNGFDNCGSVAASLFDYLHEPEFLLFWLNRLAVDVFHTYSEQRNGGSLCTDRLGTAVARSDCGCCIHSGQEWG